MLKSMRQKKKLFKVLLLFALIIGGFYNIFPILWMLFASFKTNTEIFTLPPRILPNALLLDAYETILTSPEKLRFFLNSYIVSMSVTLLTLAVGIMAGYSFSRHDFPLKKSLNTFIIATQTIPPITLMIPYFGLIVAFQLYDTYWALIFTYVVFTLPYAILMMTGYFNSLSKELDDAACVDGAGGLRVLWTILVPVALPGIIATAIYTFMLAWNEYLFALTLTRSTSMRTLPIGIQLGMNQHDWAWNEMMAMSTLGSLPVILLITFFQKYFLQGLSAGEIKS